MQKVFKKELVDKYALLIQTSSDEKQKINWLEDFLLQQLSVLHPEQDYIDIAADFIVEHYGMLQVNDLLKDSCMSRRTFERRFLYKVGLSPKYYARIRRIGYLCSLIVGKKKVDWPKVFYECNFYDQAHFIKDFEEFTGRSPQQYLKENTELANYIQKPVHLTH
jgi:AraC-like DNA-binding protein